MGSGIKDKYNIAINGKGYILKGAPDRPAYLRGVVASQIERLAISDLAYSDFAGTGLFFVAQTDWSAGIKSEKKWRDDAKYWYSTNIDTYSEQGTIQLEKELQSENDFAEVVICGVVAEVNGSTNEYVGCEDDASGNVKIYKEAGGSWYDISTTSFATSQNGCSQSIDHKNKLWVLTYGVGNTWVVASYNGSAWTDEGEVATTGIRTVSTLTNITASRCGCELAGSLYIFIDDYNSDQVALMSTADNGSTWVEEKHWNTTKIPIACANYNSKIYYILYNNPFAELRVYDPSDSSDTLIKIFIGTSMEEWGVGNKYLVEYNGKLIITIPNTKVYEYDGSTLTEIWSRDDDKNNISGNIAEGIIYRGAVEYDGRLYWANLIYDGEAFYNWKRPNGDSNTNYLWLLYANQSNSKRMLETSDKSVLWEDASTYKTTITNNFLIFNEMSEISSIEKLLHSVTIIFDKMATGQSIKMEYSIDGRATWTAVGTRTYSASDSTTRKEWMIPGSVIFNKIWWKISSDGSATTPKVRDVIMAYKPMPDYKNRWNMRFKMSDNFKLLNNQNEQRTGNDLLGELWNQKVAKQKVLFEDIDYVECSLISGITATGTSALVDNTSRLPRQGRIRAVSGSVAEEMTYTSATPNKILGIARGKRGTAARAYISGQTLKNDYDVYIEDIKSEIGFIDENKTESVAQVMLIES